MFNKIRSIIIIFLISLLIGCASLIDGLSESIYQQKDVQLLEDGAPAYLILIEGLTYSFPNNKDILSFGIQLFSAYSSAFVKDEERKKIFLEKTKGWGIYLLRTFPKFKKLENKPFEEYQVWTRSIKKKDIPYVFWGANAWLFWIIGNMDSMDALIQLPKAKAIVDRIYELDSSYYYGAPHLFRGIYYSMIPENVGGDLKLSKKEFDKAIEYSGDELLLTRVSYAQSYCKAKYDRTEFEKVLKEVLAVDIDKNPETRLLNSFAQEQAAELLENISEYFYDDNFDFLNE